MRRPKILTLLLTLALILGITLSFVSCGGTTEPTGCTEHKDENGDGVCDTEGCNEAVTPAPEEGADVFNENGELILFKDGAPTFQFVVGTDAISKHRGTVEDLAKTLADLCTATEIKTVGQTDEAMTVEILVGTVTNRGEQYSINKYDYGNNGYTVKQVGTKIVVIGGSDTALNKALDYLKTTVFGIKKSNEDFTTFAMSADKAYDVKQSNYSLKEITVAGDSIRSYVITYPQGDKTAQTNAENLQKKLYDSCGIRLEMMSESKAGDKAKISFRTIKNDGEGGGFYVSVDEDKNLIIECEFESKSVTLTTEFFEKNVFNKKNTLAIAKDFSYTPNHRDIYYKDFGAKGDGVTDDFNALKAAHDEANTNLLNVHADKDAVYYIGKANENKTITVKTNTYWHGCKFIFDDTQIEYTSSGRSTSIFTFQRDGAVTTYNQSNSPIQSLSAGATNVGWAPGYTAMIVVYNKNVRHYIRSGANASQSSDPSKWGQDQHELIIIDKDGNVDPSTPVQWTYDTVTKMEVYFVDDRPIVIDGYGDNGERTTITTWYNKGPSTYWYYDRNLNIMRSNITLKGVEHEFDKWTPLDQGGGACPYNGFTCVSNCNNVLIEDFIFFAPDLYKDSEPDPSKRPSSMQSVTGGSMGSYELSAGLANNVTWKDCTQSNFFNDDGTVDFIGIMGTNFCKNLTFDGMLIGAFDAHCGVYNGTIKNTTIEHINYIGAGTITLENVTLYADGRMHSVINFREDYGCTWNGDVIINGLTVKIHEMHGGTYNDFISSGGLRIFNARHNNWDYGYTTYTPKTVILRNILTETYTVAIVDGKRVETHVAYNKEDLNLFSKQLNDAACDFYRDDMINGSPNINKMVPTERIELYTEYTGEYATLGIKNKVPLIWPAKSHSSGYTMFKETVYVIDGVEQQ